MRDVIVRPVITEKSMKDANAGKFTFETALFANKTVIKKAVEDEFKVHVISITTAITKGKKRRQGKRRTEIEMSPWKKAIVGLKTGEKIDLFDAGTKS